MFLQVCVCPQGGVPGSGGCAWSWGGAWSQGGSVPGGCLVLGGWYPSMHWGRPPWERRLLLRTVRILLECILVLNFIALGTMDQQVQAISFFKTLQYKNANIAIFVLAVWTRPMRSAILKYNPLSPTDVYFTFNKVIWCKWIGIKNWQ